MKYCINETHQTRRGLTDLQDTPDSITILEKRSDSNETQHETPQQLGHRPIQHRYWTASPLTPVSRAQH